MSRIARLSHFFGLWVALLGLFATVPSLRAANPTTGFYDFNREVNDAAAFDGYNTTIYDHLSGRYQVVKEFSGGGYLQVDFELTLDYRGKLFGSGTFHYDEPGFLMDGNCSVTGSGTGRLDLSTLLAARVSLTIRCSGFATYDDGTTLYENVPATALMTTRLLGDFEGLPEDDDPINYLYGTGNLRMSVPRLITIRYNRFNLDFDTPIPTFPVGTWTLDTEVFRSGNQLSGTGWIVLANERELTFDLNGYYDPIFDEYVYELDGLGPDFKNYFTMVEAYDGAGYFVSFMRGRVLRNYLDY